MKNKRRVGRPEKPGSFARHLEKNTKKYVPTVKELIKRKAAWNDSHEFLSADRRKLRRALKIDKIESIENLKVVGPQEVNHGSEGIDGT